MMYICRLQQHVVAVIRRMRKGRRSKQYLPRRALMMRRLPAATLLPTERPSWMRPKK
jgi:hypothetical protein